MKQPKSENEDEEKAVEKAEEQDTEEQEEENNKDSEGNPPPKNKPKKAKTYVCIKPTFWQSKMWRVGETTNDPGAKGNCFQEV